MELHEKGTEDVFRCSDIDKGTLCMRQLGYHRLGAAPRDGKEAPVVEPTFGWSMIGGLALDDTLTKFSAGGLTASQVVNWYVYRLDHYEREFSSKGEIVQQAEGDGMDTLINEGTVLLTQYTRDVAPSLQVAGTQVEATIEIGDVTLVGHVDLVQQAGPGHRVIWDWKFTKKTPAQMPASTYVRGWAYDLLLRQDPEHGDHGQIGLIYFRRGLKTPKIETSTHFVTDAERAQVKRQVLTLTEMYRKRYFPMAAADSWVCSPRWCGYWSVCRGNPDGPSPIPGERSL